MYSKKDYTSKSSHTITGRRDPVADLKKSFVSEIYYNPILEKEITALAPNVRVNFSYWGLVDNDMSIISTRVINNRQCPELSLCGNKLTSDGISILAFRFPNNTTLKILDLSYNLIRDAGIYLLSEALMPHHSICLRKLVLNKNGVSNDGAQYLADMLKKNQVLTELWLSNNEIGNDGVKHFADVLINHNRTLKLLVLSFNVFITDVSVPYLLEVLRRNHTLNKLGINDCSLSEAGKTKLRERVTTKKKFKIKI